MTEIERNVWGRVEGGLCERAEKSMYVGELASARLYNMVYPDNESQGNVAAEIFLLCFLFYLMFDC